MLINELNLPREAWEALQNAKRVMAADLALRQRFEDLCRALSQLVRRRLKDPFVAPSGLVWAKELDGRIDVLALLSGIREVSSFWGERNLPAEDVNRTLSDLVLWMNKHHASTGRWGISVQDWLVHHFTGGLVRLGRLQFQLGRMERSLLNVPKDAAVLHVHIPEGEPLNPASCEESFRRAEGFFAAAFPGSPPQAFVCDSWLLDPVFPRILAADSNIVRFQSFFEVQVNDGNDRQMRERVFGSTDADPLAAQPSSSLQKAIQMAWRRGEVFQTALGIRR